MISPSVLIVFDPISMEITNAFPNCQTDQEEARIREKVDRMSEAREVGGKDD